jgi:hypothetical protein
VTSSKNIYGSNPIQSVVNTVSATPVVGAASVLSMKFVGRYFSKDGSKNPVFLAQTKEGQVYVSPDPKTQTFVPLTPSDIASANLPILSREGVGT